MLLLALTAIFDVWGYVAGLALLPILLVSNKTLNGENSYLYPLIPFNARAFLRLFFRLKKNDFRRNDAPAQSQNNTKTHK
jgi:stage V sporulation protein AF